MFKSRFLPNQFQNMIYSQWYPAELSMHYEDKLFCALADFNNFDNYKDLDLEIPEGIVKPEEMSSNPITISFLRFLIETHRPRHVLELGSYIGISAILMSRSMNPRGEIITVEQGPEFHRLTKRNIEHNDCGCHILPVHDEAMKALRQLPIAADLIFLDCDKPHYDKYLVQCLGRLKSKGLLVIDDVFFQGDALNDEPQTAHGLGCKRLLEAAKNVTFPKMLLPIGNGMLVIQRP